MPGQTDRLTGWQAAPPQHYYHFLLAKATTKISDRGHWVTLWSLCDIVPLLYFSDMKQFSVTWNPFHRSYQPVWPCSWQNLGLHEDWGNAKPFRSWQMFSCVNLPSTEPDVGQGLQYLECCPVDVEVAAEVEVHPREGVQPRQQGATEDMRASHCLTAGHCQAADGTWTTSCKHTQAPCVVCLLPWDCLCTVLASWPRLLTEQCRLEEEEE